jgi:tetratricopeptide (TPR) repeat protein
VTAPRAALTVAAACAALAGCLGRPAVVRVVHGEPLVGRFIDERGYEAYLRGSVAELGGRLSEAEEAYAQAHEADPGGVAQLARLGAVRCAQGPSRQADAEQAFQAAIALDRSFGPVHVERGRCALGRGELRDAERDARLGLEADPDDVEASVLLAQVAERSGRAEEAASLLDAMVLWRPEAIEAWRAMAQLAERRGDRARASVARARLDSVLRRPGASARGPALAAVDEALARGDLAGARVAAAAARLGEAALAVRAAAAGMWQEAREQAMLVLAADPTDGDALAALLASPGPAEGRRAASDPAWRRIAGGLRGATRPSALAALVLADALRRQVGDEAAAAFVDAYGPVAPEPGDALHGQLAARLGGLAGASPRAGSP